VSRATGRSTGPGADTGRKGPRAVGFNGAFRNVTAGTIPAVIFGTIPNCFSALPAAPAMSAPCRWNAELKLI